MHRLLDDGRPSRSSRTSERARYYSRVRIACIAKGHRALKGANGLGAIPWYTITDDFDKDFGVDEWHGTNAFIRDGDKVFRTYFIDKRGDEQMGSTWNYLDITALGRQEEWEDSPKVIRRPRHTSGGSGTTKSAMPPRNGAPRSSAEYRLGKDGDDNARDPSRR